jgi:hypothetical protein
MHHPASQRVVLTGVLVCAVEKVRELQKLHDFVSFRVTLLIYNAPRSFAHLRLIGLLHRNRQGEPRQTTGEWNHLGDEELASQS